MLDLSLNWRSLTLNHQKLSLQSIYCVLLRLKIWNSFCQEAKKTQLHRKICKVIQNFIWWTRKQNLLCQKKTKRPLEFKLTTILLLLSLVSEKQRNKLMNLRKFFLCKIVLTIPQSWHLKSAKLTGTRLTKSSHIYKLTWEVLNT